MYQPSITPVANVQELIAALAAAQPGAAFAVRLDAWRHAILTLAAHCADAPPASEGATPWSVSRMIRQEAFTEKISKKSGRTRKTYPQPACPEAVGSS